MRTGTIKLKLEMSRYEHTSFRGLGATQAMHPCQFADLIRYQFFMCPFYSRHPFIMWYQVVFIFSFSSLGPPPAEKKIVSCSLDNFDQVSISMKRTWNGLS